MNIKKLVNDILQEHIDQLLVKGIDRCNNFENILISLINIPIQDSIHYGYYKEFINILDENDDLYMDWYDYVCKLLFNLYHELEEYKKYENYINNISVNIEKMLLYSRPTYLAVDNKNLLSIKDSDNISSILSKDRSLLVYILTLININLSIIKLHTINFHSDKYNV